MTESGSVESLLSSLQSTVDEVLTYLEGPGALSEARVGDWGSWEVLAHFLHWHEMTAMGMESVNMGTGPVTIEEETDVVNARSIGALNGKSILELGMEARRIQQRLDAAARKMTDLDAVVMIRPEAANGQTARQRLERLVNHWSAHTRELKAQE